MKRSSNACIDGRGGMGDGQRAILSAGFRVAQLWILAGERGKARGSESRAHLVLVLEQAVHQVTVVDAHGALLLEGSLHGDLCGLPWVVRSRE